MEEEQDVSLHNVNGAANQNVAPPSHFRQSRLHLGDFWPQAPNAWFMAADLKFRVAGISNEADKFAHAVGAIPFNTLRSVMDLVERPPTENAYTTLRGCLVLAHELSAVEEAVKVLQLPANPECRPSEMLANILEYCPPGEENTAFCRAAFITRLASNVQVHLVGQEMRDLKELAQLADRFWLCHGPQMAANVEAQPVVDEEDGPVAALPTRSKGGRSRSNREQTSQEHARRVAPVGVEPKLRLSGCAGATSSLEPGLTAVMMRASAAGRETRRPGGCGHYLLGPPRPVGTPFGSGKRHAVSG